MRSTVIEVSFSVNIEAWTKWPTFCTQHFQKYFWEWKLQYFDSNLKFVLKGPTNMSTLHKPMMTKSMINIVLLGLSELTHLSLVTQICVLSPIRRQAINWANGGLLSIGLLGTNFSEILIAILSFSFKKIHLQISAKMAVILSRGRGVNESIYSQMTYLSLASTTDSPIRRDSSSAVREPFCSTCNTSGNTLAPGRPGCHFKTAIFNFILLIGIFTSFNDNAPR